MLCSFFFRIPLSHLYLRSLFLSVYKRNSNVIEVEFSLKQQKNALSAVFSDFAAPLQDHSCGHGG